MGKLLKYKVVLYKFCFIRFFKRNDFVVFFIFFSGEYYKIIRLYLRDVLLDINDFGILENVMVKIRNGFIKVKFEDCVEWNCIEFYKRIYFVNDLWFFFIEFV